MSQTVRDEDEMKMLRSQEIREDETKAEAIGGRNYEGKKT